MIEKNFHALKERIKDVLNEVAHIKEIKQEVGKEFMSRNLPTRRAMNVFMGIESLDTLSNIEEDARFLYMKLSRKPTTLVVGMKAY